ncbi:MAG: hypothetical protein CUN55_02075 [Phototrophicales bacterium]|nr:MAG: hypothetical protein CUN55_02075 [Phototrophicales bacterium]
MDISLDAITSNPKTNARALLRISLESALYIAIFTFGLILRVVQLDAVSLNGVEAHEALAALHRVQPHMTENPAIANNPLMALINQFLFFVITDNNFTARIATAIVGALLILTPYLWRERLGRVAALVMSLFICISPVALVASRTMGGVIWTMFFAMITVWAFDHAHQKQDKGLAILVSACVGIMLFLTEPTGAFTVVGLVFGALFALWTRHDTRNTWLSTVGQVTRAWPWRDALLLTLGIILVVGTGLFASPNSLTFVGSTFYRLLSGFVSRPDDLPAAFALVVALRYDLGLVLFGLLGMYFALVEGDQFSRFLAGWLFFSVIVSVFYQNSTPDAALWIVIPAAGLAARLTTQMLRDPSIGYWEVPRWAIPVHAFITASLLVSIAINTTRISHVLYLEARPFGYHFLTNPLHSAEISSLDDNISQNVYQIDTASNVTVSFVAQIWRYQGDIEPIMRVVVEEPQANGEVQEVLVAGPYTYDELKDGVAISLRGSNRYLIKVSRSVDQSNARGQYAFITHPPNAIEGNSLFNYRLDAPFFWTLVRSLSNQNLPPLTLMITVFLLMLLLISYFLAGSIWGSRTAWRGVGFGFLIYFLIYGMGLGWQASTVYANDPRELWYNAEPAPQHLNTIIQTLEDMSIQAHGIRNAIEITVLGKNDTPLAWALRNFPNAVYVNSIGGDTNTEAVIVPYAQRNTNLSGDYVGQDFALSQMWHWSTLSWADFPSWLMLRETSTDPIDTERVMLWIRKDVYGVQEVIPTQSN